MTSEPDPRIEGFARAVATYFDLPYSEVMALLELTRGMDSRVPERLTVATRESTPEV